MPKLMSVLGIDTLSATERFRLVDEIWDSLEENEPEAPEITTAQRLELDRRLALLDTNGTTVSPWTDVEARVRARIAQ